MSDHDVSIDSMEKVVHEPDDMVCCRCPRSFAIHSKSRPRGNYQERCRVDVGELPRRLAGAVLVKFIVGYGRQFLGCPLSGKNTLRSALLSASDSDLCFLLLDDLGDFVSLTGQLLAQFGLIVDR